MNKLAIAALALLAGCGFGGGSRWRSGTTYTGAQPSFPTAVSSAPDYWIDAGASIAPQIGTYGITTNGQGDWIIGWQGDAYKRRFTGNVYCEVGCDIDSATFLNALPGDVVTTVANNHIGFDAVTDASVRQQLNIALVQAPGQRPWAITFDLAIDGVPAVDPYTVFSSGGQLATTQVMPVSLIPNTTGVYSSEGDKIQLAPLSSQAKDKDSSTTFTLPAPAQRSGGANTQSLKGAQ
jgi:hypothetical protein